MRKLSSVLVIGALTLPLSAGCDNKPPVQPPAQVSKKPAPHAHPEEGPHHGYLIELGNEEYHAELTHDDKTHKVTIYLLDSTGKKSVPTTAKEVTINLVTDGKPAQFTLPAVPLESEGAGQSSRFELADKALCDGWDAPKTKGRINVTIGGKAFVGTIEHQAHAGHKD